MKDSPTIKITMEGAEGCVEITRAVMGALCFTTTDYLKYAEENYMFPEDTGKLAEAIKRIREYMYPKDGNI